MSHEMTQLLRKALGYADDGNYLEMTRLAKKVVQEYPEVPEMHYVLGCGHMKSGEYKLAANSFQNATSKKADFAKAYYCRTECLFFLGDFDSALSEWTLLSSIDQALSASLQQNIFKFLMS